MKKQDFFVSFLSLVAFRLGWEGTRPPHNPGYTYECNFNAICHIKVFCAFLLVCFFACQSDTNSSILYDHAKYVILLVKVKMVLNSICDLKL